jgi:hypothetical protein
MNKLMLRIDDLKVESFEIAEAGEERGTVLGASEPEPAPISEIMWCASGAGHTGPCCGYSLEISCAETSCVACGPG